MLLHNIAFEPNGGSIELTGELTPLSKFRARLLANLFRDSVCLIGTFVQISMRKFVFFTGVLEIKKILGFPDQLSRPFEISFITSVGLYLQF